MRCSIPVCMRSRLSGSWLAVNFVSTAIIPHPISTPTAAGMTPPDVGITEPMVEPLPKWQSGITATWPASTGDCDVLMSCCRASGSIVSGGRNVTILSLNLNMGALAGAGTPVFIRSHSGKLAMPAVQIRRTVNIGLRFAGAASRHAVPHANNPVQHLRVPPTERYHR